MSNSTSETLAGKLEETRDLEAEVAVIAAEKALRDVVRSQERLRELRRLFERLTETGASFHTFSSRLVNMTISAAAEAVGAPRIGRPSVTQVEKLADLARQSTHAARDFESAIRTSLATVDELLTVADQSRRTLEALIPTLKERAESAARVADAPAQIRVVIEPPTATRGGARATGDIVHETWPDLLRSASRLKN
jgi:hypothetical protein